jgi:hypothetical protein
MYIIKLFILSLKVDWIYRVTGGNEYTLPPVEIKIKNFSDDWH